jgi:hypothetical protein
MQNKVPLSLRFCVKKVPLSLRYAKKSFSYTFRLMFDISFLSKVWLRNLALTSFMDPSSFAARVLTWIDKSDMALHTLPKASSMRRISCSLPGSTTSLKPILDLTQKHVANNSLFGIGIPQQAYQLENDLSHYFIVVFQGLTNVNVNIWIDLETPLVQRYDRRKCLTAHSGVVIIEV